MKHTLNHRCEAQRENRENEKMLKNSTKSQMNFYKILNKEEKHHGMQYKTGLNVDCRPFNPQGDCEPGGIYFSREDIFAFLNHGPWIRKVTLLEDVQVYENPGSPKKWKADKVILGERRKINLQIIKELVEEGANIHAGDDYILKWAAKNGYLDIVKFLVKKGANVHAENDYSLLWASRNGHLNVVKFLVKHGADTRTCYNYALRLASEYGHFEVVKFLVKCGIDINMRDGEALKWASRNGHFKVVKYLIKCGVNIHAVDCALKWATENKHFNIVKFLIEYKTKERVK